MNVLLPLLMVAIGPPPPIEARYPEAVEVFRCTFDQKSDENFDTWPDRWTRRRGPGFPSYVDIKINQESSPTGNRCLRIDLNGGAAVAYSPPIKAGPLFSYVVEGYVKTEGLNYDRAYFSVTLLDGQRQRMETFSSEKVRRTDGWKKLRVGPISPPSDDVRFAVVGLHVEPQSRQDLKGAALFDDVWLARLPRMSLNTSSPHSFFTEAGDVEIHCNVSGLPESSPQVTFQLEDVLGQELARVERRLATRPASTNVELSLDSFADRPEGLIGQASWKPPIAGPGFYRVRATMKGLENLVQRRELSLVVVEPRHPAPGGEFGWSLPRGDKPLPLPALSSLIGQAGINWVKYPAWYAEEDSEELAGQLMAFSERLTGQGVELVGLLHEPPLRLRSDYGQSGPLSAAAVFDPDPKVWYPSLEPVMTRLATRVHWWQLGRDKDTSFVHAADVAGQISRVKNELDRIGQDVNLAIGWSWMHQLPHAADGNAPWRALSLSADPPMTHEELAACLEASKGTTTQRWAVIEPLPADSYQLEVRAADLVRRMIAAKIHGADAVFCPQPFSTDRGLMGDEGSPGELFLPWRITALTLGGATYLGSIQLPGGSPNQVFARIHDVVIVVWNHEPTQEVLYLGEEVQQIDVWGRQHTPATKGHRQVIDVGRLPTFVTGINEPLARCRMDFAFARERIPSTFGQPHLNSFRLKNHFARAITGRATLVTPEVWIVEGKQTSFQLGEGEQFEHGFEITLPYSASSGPQKVRVDFQLQADGPYQFSVYREIGVGTSDVYVEISTGLNDQGELKVHQRFINATDSAVSFACQLFVPDRRRLRTQIVGLTRGSDAQVYRLPDGKELLGKTLWLRAQELGGPRILNYRFVAEP